MGRTKPVKKKSKRTKPVDKEPGQIPIPDYKIGSIIKKGDAKFIIIEDYRPGDFDGIKRFTVINKETRKEMEKVTTAIELAIYGYRIVRQLPFEEVMEIKNNLNEKKQRKDRDRPRPGYCNLGDMYTLEQCEVVEGISPLIRGAKVKMKGRRVIDVKVECPECGKKVGLIYSKRENRYLARRHKLRKKKGRKNSE